MKTRLHANARTTPKVRAEIQASHDPVAVLARRHGVSETTIRKWRRRSDIQDRSHVRHDLGQATSPEDERLIAELRTRAGLSLDDITEVMNRCVHPGLSRDSVWRALRRLGLNRRPRGSGPGAAQSFEDTPFGFVHVDLMYLGKLGGVPEFTFVAIERTSRFVHVEVLPDRRIATVTAAMERFLAAFGHPVHTVLTDNGAEFTDRFRTGSRAGAEARPTGSHPFDRLCAAHGIRHKLTRPYRPQTNGMVERFNRRLGEAMRNRPPARDNSRHRTVFLDREARTAFILRFVENYNRTRLRCLDYQAPIAVLSNQTQHNTGRGLLPRPRSRAALGLFAGALQISRTILVDRNRVLDEDRVCHMAMKRPVASVFKVYSAATVPGSTASTRTAEYLNSGILP